MLLPQVWRPIQRRVQKLFAQGRPKAALRLCRAYVRWLPAHPASWLFLAQSLVKVRRYQEAEDVLEKGIARLPQSEVLAYFRGLALIIVRRDFDAGKVYFNEITVKYPEHPYPYIGLCMVAVREQAWEEARRFARLAEARLDPSHEGGTATPLEHLGDEVIAIPGELEWGKRLLVSASEISTQWMPLLTVALLEESYGVDGNHEYFRRARRRFPGPDHAWDEEVENQRSALNNRLAHLHRMNGQEDLI